MNADIHIHAIRRYAVLTGDCEDMTQAEHLQAIADREAYGSEYLPKGLFGLDNFSCGSCTMSATLRSGRRVNAW